MAYRSDEMNQAGLLQDKVVVVTGAGGGIGRDIALATSHQQQPPTHQPLAPR